MLNCCWCPPWSSCIFAQVLERAIEWVATLPPAIIRPSCWWLRFGPDLPLAVRRRAEHQPSLAGLNAPRDSRLMRSPSRDHRGRSIDVKTLVRHPARSVPPGPKVFFKVIIRTYGSLILSSFISIAVVLGEYTVASLLGRNSAGRAHQLGSPILKSPPPCRCWLCSSVRCSSLRST